MELLSKHNILELIGKNSSRYHSAIVTAYSFDFSFFEGRLLPVFRAANIKNVQVFIDGHFLETALEHTTGREFDITKTYVLSGVYVAGIFHPKIMLLTGQKEGLLLIGSGNLTGSGINSNDEIWATFHFGLPSSPHAGIFYESWQYLQGLYRHSNGFSRNTLEWIKKHSPWLGSLRQAPVPGIRFLFNSLSGSILDQLTLILPKASPDAVTIVSPYYDKDGSLLELINTRFKPRKIRCAVDPEFGLLPVRYQNKNVAFYDWKNCVPGAARLHAKLFHFIFGKEEFLLLGSANATLPGLGGTNKTTLNDEVCILLDRRSSFTYLEQLNIYLKGEQFLMPPKQKPINAYPARLAYPCKIAYAEAEAQALSLYFNQYREGDYWLIVYDKSMREADRAPVHISSSMHQLIIQKSSQVFKVCLYDSAIRQSNYMLVHQVELLNKNNPDPKLEKLDNLFKDIANGLEENITDLFEYLSYNWADEDSADAHANNRAPAANNAGEPKKDYTILDEDEFNIVTHEMKLKQEGILTSANIRIADFLGQLSQGITGVENSYDDSPESREMSEPDGGSGIEVKGRLKALPPGQKTRKSILRFYKKLLQSYELLTEDLYMNPGRPSTQRVTISGLSAILIALQVFCKYHGKKFIEQEGGTGEAGAISQLPYIAEGDWEQIGSDEWFFSDIVSKFLMLCSAGYRTYDYAVLNAKVSEMRQEAFVKALFGIFNIAWPGKAAQRRNLLLLNMLHVLLPRKSSGHWRAGWESELKVLEQRRGMLHHNYKNNKEWFFKRLLPAYIRWAPIFKSNKETLLRPTTDISPGQVLFKNPYGFCSLHSLASKKPPFLARVEAPGLPWDPETGRAVSESIAVGSRMVCFEEDIG